MKRKALIIVLLLLVVSIWGAVLSRAFIHDQTEEEPITSSLPVAWPEGSFVEHFPPLDSLGGYGDPFQDHVLRTAPPAARVPPKVAQAREIRPASQPFKWPTISYKGCIRNARQGKAIALLSLNGKDIMIAEGASESGIEAVSVQADSVVLVAQNERRVVGR